MSGKVCIMCVRILIILFSFGFASAADNSDIIKYLNNSVNFSPRVVAGGGNSDLINSYVVNAVLDVNLGNEYSNVTIENLFYLKTPASLKSFESINDLIASPDFIKSIDKNFSLKSEPNADILQKFFMLLDDFGRGEGYFNKGDCWYFIRNKFFSDIEAWRIKVDNSGRIDSINYVYSISDEIPGELSGKSIIPDKNSRKYLSPEDSLKIISELVKKADYNFIVEEKNLNAEGISEEFGIFNGRLDIKKTYEGGGGGTMNFNFILLTRGDKYHIFQSGKSLLCDDLFVGGVLNNITLKDGNDALAFTAVIDSLNPVSEPEKENCRVFNKDDIWFFVREKSFDDLYGYMLKTDENDKINIIDYNKFSEENILKFRMKDPDFKVDYAFKLVKPETNSIKLKNGESLSVQVDFNSEAASAAGAWILTKFDNKKTGFYAGTSIESPYMDDVPAEVLTPGKHILEYLLIPSGSDTSNPIAGVKIDIEVK